MASLTLMFFRGPVSKGSQPYSAVLGAQYVDIRLHNPAGERSKLIDGRDSGGGGGWWGGGVGSASCPHAFLKGGQIHTCKDLKSHPMGRRGGGQCGGEGARRVGERAAQCPGGREYVQQAWVSLTSTGNALTGRAGKQKVCTSQRGSRGDGHLEGVRPL